MNSHFHKLALPQRFDNPGQCRNKTREWSHLVKVIDRVLNITTLFDMSDRFTKGELSYYVVDEVAKVIGLISILRFLRNPSSVLGPSSVVHSLASIGKSRL